jgi:hypothetical protein
MTDSHRPLRLSRALADLTVHELARIRLLNDELTHTERWIVAHASTLWRPRVTEVFDVRARVCCVARSGFSGDGDGEIVARLDVRALLENTRLCTAPLAAPLATEAAALLFTNMEACSLFRELSERCLPCKWDRLLAIDDLRVELTISREAIARS